MPNTRTTEVVQQLAEATERAARLEFEAKAERVRLESALRLARGTRETLPIVPGALVGRIRDILSGPAAPCSLVALVAAVGEPAGRVLRELRRLRATPCETRSLTDAPDARAIYNHGTEDAPQWQWVIGDEAPTEDLLIAVEAMISRRPYTFAELTAATGARRGRLSGVIVQMQRHGYPLRNIGGSDRQYRWFLAPRGGRV